MGSTSAATNGGSTSNVGAARAVANSALDASLALLASTSSSSIVEVVLLDPARLEADIVSQLYLGTTISLMGYDHVPPLVRDRQARSLISPSASALYSSNVAPLHTSRFDNLLDQSTSMVFNPTIFSVESHYSLPVDLNLGIYGNFPCDLPRVVVRDALAVNLGTRCGATGLGFNNFEISEHV